MEHPMITPRVARWAHDGQQLSWHRETADLRQNLLLLGRKADGHGQPWRYISVYAVQQCEYIHIYIYVYIFTYLFTYIFIYLSIYLFIYLHACAYIHTYIDTYITLHYITSHHITLHYITLHCITLIHTHLFIYTPVFIY